MEQIINAERIEQIISVFGSFDTNIKKVLETQEACAMKPGKRPPCPKAWRNAWHATSTAWQPKNPAA